MPRCSFHRLLNGYRAWTAGASNDVPINYDLCVKGAAPVFTFGALHSGEGWRRGLGSLRLCDRHRLLSGDHGDPPRGASPGHRCLTRDGHAPL
jgi:hypothetical protein